MNVKRKKLDGNRIILLIRLVFNDFFDFLLCYYFPEKDIFGINYPIVIKI